MWLVCAERLHEMTHLHSHSALPKPTSRMLIEVHAGIVLWELVSQVTHVCCSDAQKLQQ